jgi:hypothetical protein
MAALWIAVVHCVKAAFTRHAMVISGAWFGGSSRSNRKIRIVCYVLEQGSAELEVRVVGNALLS